MKNITTTLSYYDVIRMIKGDAQMLIEADKKSHADVVAVIERMQRYPKMLKDTWGNGFGND